MNDLEVLINLNQSKFNSNDKKLLSCLKNIPQQCQDKSLKQLSQITSVPKSEIFRFCKKIGLNGYSEFKFKYTMFLNNDENISSNEIKNFDNLALAIQKIRYEFLNSNLNQLYLNLNLSKKIYIFTTGWKEELIANYLSYKLFTINKNCIVLPFNQNEVKLVLKYANSNEMFLIISYIKLTQEINQKLSNLKYLPLKTKTILLINQNNKIFKNIQWQFYYPTINLQIKKDFYNKTETLVPAFYLVDQLINEIEINNKVFTRYVK